MAAVMIKSIVAAVLQVFAFLGPVSANQLTEAQVVMAVRDLSGGDKNAVDAARAALAGKRPAEDPYQELADEFPVFAAIASGFHATGRLAVLDWAEGLQESSEALSRLFRKAGLDPDGPLTRLKGVMPSKRGEAVGIAYLAFRPAAEAAGMRIVSLNADSDSSYFVLAPREAAERWRSVRIGENQYIEDSDWQFLSQVEAAGLTPRSTRHPSQDERPAPKAP